MFELKPWQKATSSQWLSYYQHKDAEVGCASRRPRGGPSWMEFEAGHNYGTFARSDFPVNTAAVIVAKVSKS